MGVGWRLETQPTHGKRDLGSHGGEGNCKFPRDKKEDRQSSDNRNTAEIKSDPKGGSGLAVRHSGRKFWGEGRKRGKKSPRVPRDRKSRWMNPSPKRKRRKRAKKSSKKCRNMAWCLGQLRKVTGNAPAREICRLKNTGWAARESFGGKRDLRGQTDGPK